jgi:ribonuclease-3
LITVAEWAPTALQYAFSDPGLLEQALTHRSKGNRNYERLEFLGDSILNFVIAEALFERFPAASEGPLSRSRAALVRKETLAQLARSLDLGARLLLGGGELKSGGFNRDSILADSLEAIIGAIYVDGGIMAARDFVLRLYESLLSDVNPARVQKDPKTRLQEMLQERGMRVPDYEVLEVRGEAHDQHFVVQCRVEALDTPVRGEGSSRRRAEQDAATRAIEQLSKGVA